MKAIIFDLFGTLVYIDRPTHPYRDLLEKATNPDARKIVLTSNATPLRMAREIGVDLSAESGMAVVQRIQDEVDSIKVYPDVLDALSRLKSEGYLIIVSSNLARPYARARDLLDGYVDYWNFSFDTGTQKPDPVMFTGPAAAYGLEPGNCLVVGDSIGSDGVGAAEAGMSFMLLDRHGRHPSHRAVSSLTELFEANVLPA